MQEVFGIPPGELAERLFYDQQHPMAQMLHAAGETSWAAPPPDDVLLAFHQSTEATARVAWNPYFHDPSLPERLDRIAAPTLLLWGAEDRLIPIAHAERYRASIREATLKTIPRCGHLPVIERPEEFAREVGAFLLAHPLPFVSGPEAA
jgi:pimeloyl-ACP methyl ester carboxylesterase